MAYELQEARKLVIKAGLELLSSGLIARTWGNISARISDTQFVITPSGLAYEDLTPEKIVITNVSDCSYQGRLKPSSEKWIHADAYRLRPDVNFVIHTHQNYASALSILGETISEIPMEGNLRSILGPEIPTAGYGLNGSQELSRNVIRAIEEHPSSAALLMSNHGAECMGTDYAGAFAIAHALEDVAKSRYRSMLQESDLLRSILPTKEEMDAVDLCSSDLSGYYRVVDPRPYSMPAAAFSSAPFTAAASRLQISELFPYIDDQAQMIGTSLRVIPQDADDQMVQNALQERNAVLVREKGAICTGDSPEDVNAAVMVLEKGCRAALLAMAAGDSRKIPPLHPEHAAADRSSYVNSYSKLKNAGRENGFSRSLPYER